MEETTVSIIGIFIAAIMMFIVPLILIADRTDDISQLVVKTATAEFVDEIIKTGKITNDKYTKFVNELKNKLDAKDRVIEEYKKAIEELEKKNQLQADKIQSLTKKTSHSIEEYKNNGLRKNMKKKRGN